jgi:single-stranded-DNA-specific exonuclease
MAEVWRLRSAEANGAQQLAAGLGTRELTARILLARGYATPETAARFLSPRLADLRPPEGIADLDRAIARIAQAVAGREQMAVFGDFDVDGITSAAILILCLRTLGLAPVVRVAKRAAGYGFALAEARAFAEQGVTLVLTCDCGTSDRESLALCRARGIDVIVLDHHHVPTGESEAYALLNSHRGDDRFPFKGLASCGVAFYVAAALRTRLRALGEARAVAIEPRAWLDLVALGTVADLVPLVHENRILVSAGLRELAARRRPGLAALAESAGLAAGGSIGTADVSFRLAPRLNAAGRLGDAQLALDLLLATDSEQGQQLASALEDLNRERQRIQENVWIAAVAAAEGFADAPALVLGGEGWHQGVVGIVAAKLVDKYRKPAVVVAFQGGQGRGSARTLGGFDLTVGLGRCRDHLLGFGGHPAAAGVTLAEDQLAAFRSAFVAAAAEHAARRGGEGALEVDTVAQLAELDLAQAEELARLGPFGTDNSEPLLAISGVSVRRSRVVGNSHLLLDLAHGHVVVPAIAFGMGEQNPGQGTRLDVIGTAEVDEFSGQRKMRLRVRHFTRSMS